MRMRSWIPLLLALTSFGCGAERRIAAPATETGAPGPGGRLTAPGASGNAPGAVYTMTNSPAGNAVLLFTRTANGGLDAPTPYATGGLGTGSGLGNQGGIALGDGNQWLFVVNAGSNSISMFRVSHGSIELVNVSPSGGPRPTSLTVYHDLLYVLNAGGLGIIQGYRIDPAGALLPIAGSARPLSDPGAAPAQIGFTPDGSELVVTERATDRLSVYQVAADGTPSGPHPQPSVGRTPFGFGFDQNRTLIVSEAFGGEPLGSAVSSYALGHDGSITPVSLSVHTLHTAACWIAVTDNGKYAYAGNAGGGVITGYSIANDGTLALLDPSGVSAPTGPNVTELTLSSGSQYLYALRGQGGVISGYAVHGDGSLEPLGSHGPIPPFANGLVAR